MSLMRKKTAILTKNPLHSIANHAPIIEAQKLMVALPVLSQDFTDLMPHYTIVARFVE